MPNFLMGNIKPASTPMIELFFFRLNAEPTKTLRIWSAMKQLSASFCIWHFLLAQIYSWLLLYWSASEKPQVFTVIRLQNALRDTWTGQCHEFWHMSLEEKRYSCTWTRTMLMTQRIEHRWVIYMPRLPTQWISEVLKSRILTTFLLVRQIIANVSCCTRLGTDAVQKCLEEAKIFVKGSTSLKSDIIYGIS